MMGEDEDETRHYVQSVIPGEAVINAANNWYTGLARNIWDSDGGEGPFQYWQPYLTNCSNTEQQNRERIIIIYPMEQTSLTNVLQTASIVF